MEAKEWKKAKKTRMSTRISADLHERLRWESYSTRKTVGQILTELAIEHLVEPPSFTES